MNKHYEDSLIDLLSQITVKLVLTGLISWFFLKNVSISFNENLFESIFVIVITYGACSFFAALYKWLGNVILTIFIGIIAMLVLGYIFSKADDFLVANFPGFVKDTVANGSGILIFSLPLVIDIYKIIKLSVRIFNINRLKNNTNELNALSELARFKQTENESKGQISPNANQPVLTYDLTTKKVTQEQEPKNNNVWAFEKRKSILTDREAIVYKALKFRAKEFSDKNNLSLDVHAKVRLADIVNVKNTVNYDEAFFNKTKAKHVDFLLLNDVFGPVIVVEADDSSHAIPDRSESDRFKNELFNEVSVRVLRITKFKPDEIDHELKVFFDETCPKCFGQLVLRTNSKTGESFWGCANFMKGSVMSCNYNRSI